MSEERKPPGPAIPGSEPRIHHSTRDTAERTYDRLRRDGTPPDAARKITEEVTRRAHDKLDKNGG